MSKRGFSLLEVLITVALIGAMTALLAPLVGDAIRAQKNVSGTADRDTDIQNLTSHLQKIGRLARACQYDATAPALRCDVDFNRPPTGALTTVRFHLTATGVEYEQSEGGKWIARIHYPAVIGMDICDDAIMKGKKCPISPANLSDEHGTELGQAGALVSRFFRFRLKARKAGASASATDPVVYSQSAFFVRNPGPNGIIYSWGSEK